MGIRCRCSEADEGHIGRKDLVPLAFVSRGFGCGDCGVVKRPFANFTVLSDHQNFFRHVGIFTGFASNSKIVLEVVSGEGGDVGIC